MHLRNYTRLTDWMKNKAYGLLYWLGGNALHKSLKKGQIKKLLSVLLSFLKVGFIGFGGGSALIPVIEEEAVAKKKLLKEENYNNDVIVSNITPGALPVKLAAAAGRRVNGIPGMIGAAVMVSLPGVLLTIILISIISKLNDSVLNQIEYASAGISVFIIMLLVHYIGKVLRDSKKSGTFSLSFVIMLIVFLLTGEKEIYSILNINRTPVFDISTINILLLSFFIIFSVSGKISWLKETIIGIISILFVLSAGKAQIISNEPLTDCIKAVMLLFICCSIIRNIKSSGVVRNVPIKNLTAELAAWAIFLILFSVPAAALLSGTVRYLEKGFLSTVISFGGGEAYLTVADSIFVSDGIIPSEAFYNQILPIANALPGPILSKVLSGIGFVLGFKTAGSILSGYLLSLVGYAVSLTASCSVFFIINYIYNRFESLDIFKTLKKWILPIVCGLLLSTIVSMLQENLKIITKLNCSGFEAFLICAMMFSAIFFLQKKFHLNDVVLILTSGLASLIICNII